MDKFTGTEKVMGTIFESKATRDQRLKEAEKQKKLQEIKDKEAKLTKLNESKKPVKEADVKIPGPRQFVKTINGYNIYRVAKQYDDGEGRFLIYDLKSPYSLHRFNTLQDAEEFANGTQTESKKPVKEAYGDTIREIELIPTPTSQDIPDSLLDMMWDRSANGIVIEPRHEQTPFAWDADFEIVGSEFIVRGGIGPGGPGYGSVVIKLPLNKASRYYRIFINPDFGQMSEEFVEFSETMTELGWKLKF